MKIECIVDEELVRKQGPRLYKLRLYTVKVNGEAILECLPEYDLDDLTIGEIRELAREMTAAPNGTARVAAG